MPIPFPQSLLAALSRPVYGGIGHILMFHRISSNANRPHYGFGSRIEVTPGFFEHTLDFFARRDYEFASLDRLAELLAGPKPKRKFVAITFDDGYLDNFTLAAPILRQRDIPFAVYVTTSFPDRTAILWWDMLEKLLATRQSIVLPVDGHETTFDLTTPDGKFTAAERIRKMIKTAGLEDFEPTIQRIFEPCGISARESVEELAMSWEQIQELSRDPLATIGAHTVNHLVLSKMPAGTVREEITRSRQILEERLGRPVQHFAYPFGGRNEAGLREFEIAKQCGFKTITTTRFANVQYAHRSHLECLPRLDMPWIGSLDALELAISGWSPARRNRLQRVVTE